MAELGPHRIPHSVFELPGHGTVGVQDRFPSGDHSELNVMKRPIFALVLTAGLAMATVAAPTQAQARWGGWGWGVGGFALGALAGAAIASSAYAYPGYYGGYGYPAYSYGYGYPAYGYGYPAYSYGYAYPAYRSYAYAPRPYVRRRVVIHRSRWH